MSKEASNEIKRLEKSKVRTKKTTPKFMRTDRWRFKKIETSWRHPIGLDNKIRQQKRGWPRKVKSGYGTPRKLRGRHPSSLEEVLIHNQHDLELINPRTQAIRIGGTVGRKKRLRIAEMANIIGIHVLNPEYAPTEGVEFGEDILQDEDKSTELELDQISADDLDLDDEDLEDTDEENDEDQ